jgi:hypothetical protein
MGRYSIEREQPRTQMRPIQGMANEQEQTEKTEEYFSVPSVASCSKQIVGVDGSWLFLRLIVE